jgi:Tfp pilus assembly protein FimT
MNFRRTVHSIAAIMIGLASPSFAQTSQESGAPAYKNS